MVSKDYKEINNFINKYPNNSNVPFLIRRAESLSPEKNNPSRPDIARVRKQESVVYKPNSTSKTENSNSQTSQKDIKNSEPAPKKLLSKESDQKKTADILNHLLNGNANSKEAYVVIKNKSICNIDVIFTGKKTYTLKVVNRDKNYILIEKGTYTITTNLCNAKYSSVKNINGDVEISLDAPGQKKASKYF